ncbi:hypothetical protein TNCV_4229131 [Trichonephila clavipes]|nr:hypothetical protein TNCV_4229131 [Trichonephila clavipes]
MKKSPSSLTLNLGRKVDKRNAYERSTGYFYYAPEDFDRRLTILRLLDHVASKDLTGGSTDTTLTDVYRGRKHRPSWTFTYSINCFVRNKCLYYIVPPPIFVSIAIFMISCLLATVDHIVKVECKIFAKGSIIIYPFDEKTNDL